MAAEAIIHQVACAAKGEANQAIFVLITVARLYRSNELGERTCDPRHGSCFVYWDPFILFLQYTTLLRYQKAL